MKRFAGAADDLGGTPHDGSANSDTAVAREVTEALGGDHAGTGERMALSSRGEGALDTLDCSLGRSLAEARLQSAASREVKQHAKKQN